MFSRLAHRVSRHLYGIFIGRRTAEIACILAVLLAVSFVAWWLVGEVALLVALLVLAALMLIGLSAALRAINRLGSTTSSDYRQVEALFSIFCATRPEFPLPATRGWAASPDFLKEIAQLVLERRPDTVFELGSGVSSLVIAHCLRRNGKGRLISLEHELKYANATRNSLSLHDLQDTATVVYAPLVDHEIRGAAWPWYETDHLRIDQSIDLLLVDGPPRLRNSLARYPALPLLREYLRPDSIAIVDDGAKRDQKKVVELWLEEFPGMTYDYLDLEKGAFVLHLHGEPESGGDNNPSRPIPGSLAAGGVSCTQ
jgi:predicted O-methyltransferase YrrM